MSKKIKVVHIINNLEVGGAEKVLFLLLKKMKEHLDVETIVVSLEGTGPLTAAIRKLGVEVKEFNYHLFTPFSRLDPYFRFGLYSYLKKNNPDIIHGHLIRGEDFAKVMGGILKKPVITTSHDSMIWPGRKQRFLNRYLNKAVAVSQNVADHLEVAYKLPKEKITVIHDTVDFEECEGSQKKFNKNEPVFLYIGRIFPTKGIDYAIKGLAQLLIEYPKLKFLIYGKEVFKGDEEKLRKLTEKNKWDFVKFMGRTDNIGEALKKGDIFILASKTEGFGMAALEAAVAGKPLIVTKAGSLPEMVDVEKSGFIVEYGKPEQITAAAKKILKNNVEEFGKNSSDFVQEKFSINKMTEMYYNLYLKTKDEKERD